MKKDEQEESVRGNQRVQEGIVVSNKMTKSIVVSVQMYKKHPQYGKYVRNTMKFMAHDENNECAIGDKVVIKESRPLSKNKRWRLQRIVERAA
ncbi:MAG TPA: 30S ribosomal protein S17 [Oligoflexia bacterium]|nr:30S ribosomal protein S17 [Oligoflexia bacterium]HMP49196.1 30S ribosomal protein S17 [Oligoflexia bacterium]